MNPVNSSSGAAAVIVLNIAVDYAILPIYAVGPAYGSMQAKIGCWVGQSTTVLAQQQY